MPSQTADGEVDRGPARSAGGGAAAAPTDAGDRLAAVLDAVVTIAVDPALDRIVHAARRLIGARYGALALLNPDGSFGDVVTSGLADDEHPDLVGLGPTGDLVLERLAIEQRPLRLAHIAADPLGPTTAASGADQATMQSFLGVPISIGVEVFGLLWLTEKADGGHFDVEDERLLIALATAAGTTIGNARLYVAAEQRRRWLEAAGEITAHLLGDGDRDSALALVAGRAREVAQADAAFVALPSDDCAELVFEVVDGLHAGPWRGFSVPIARSVEGHVLLTGSSLSTPDAWRSATAANPDYALPKGARPLGPLMAVPLGAGSLRGVLLLARETGRLAFTDDELNLATSFAGHAALALERARARMDRAKLAVYEDRDRIARDLHDVVIQRLFAAGLQLHSIRRRVPPPIAEALLRLVRELDDTIRDIRTTIFDLRPPADGGALTDVYATVDDAARALGFKPAIRLAGAAGQGLPDAVRPHLLAVLREALSNVARHAEASSVEVFLEIGEEVRLAVRDNGKGLPRAWGRRGGTRTMRERAAVCGGRCTIRTRPSGGTSVVWRVPARASASASAFPGVASGGE